MTLRLRVNPITCAGHGICAVLLPERVSLDDWGYPIIDPEPIDSALEVHARRAVAACPTLALTLVEEPVAKESLVGERPVSRPQPRPAPPPPWVPADRGW